MQNLKVVGITGSYGKTTTKEILAHILSSKFRVVKTKEHQNSEVGVSRAITDDLKPEHEIFVCEMGAYNKGGITLLADIAQPQIAVLTGANEQHLATFGSMENLLSAEGGKELVDALPTDGVAIFNGANAHAKKLYEETTKKKILCGSGGALFAKDVKAEQEKLTFKIIAQGKGEALVEAPLLGAHNVENILLATTVALELGMTLEEIAQACRTIPQSAGAMILKRGKGGLRTIDSSYSANPSGVLADLEYLKVWPSKKVVVMPSLIELGNASKEAHQKIGKKIAEVCDLGIITTQDHVQDIREGAGEEKDKIIFLADWKHIVERVQLFCQAGDVVLLGGRVPVQIIQNLCSE
jgi:UDP-N-acetylmuramoyl-tripeptide--D-alanyl-D-alanine ligase